MKFTTTILLVALSLGAMAQTTMPLSLKEAQEMAAEHSYKVLQSVKGTEQAEKQVKETIGIGLPQVSAFGGYDHFLDVPVQSIPNFLKPILDPIDPDNPSPDFIQAAFGTEYNMVGEVRVDQLLFDAVYFVGLKASRTVQEQADLGLEKTRIESKHAAARAYLACLVYQENKRILVETITVLEKLHSDTKAMYEQGFMESTDVDQQELSLLNTQNELITVERSEDVALKTLNFILGQDILQELTLTSNLQSILEAPEFTNVAGTKLMMESHIDHKLSLNNVARKTANHKYQRSFFFPQLTGYFKHSQNAMRSEFNFLESGNEWFPTTAWGLGLSVPIFSGGKRHFSTQRARLALEQSEIELHETEQNLLLEVDREREDFIAADRKYENEEKNLELARRIFDSATIKYGEGMNTSFELTQKQSQYLVTQRSYIQSLVDLLLARTELQKALNLY